MYKRVSFYLSESLNTILAEQASKHGISKAKLIKENLDNLACKPLRLNINEENNSKSYLFNLRLSISQYNTLRTIANQNKIRPSSLLRSLILPQEVPQLNKYTDSDQILGAAKIKELWKSGNLGKINEHLSKNLERYPTDSILYFAQAHSEIGRFKEAFGALDLLHTRLNSEINFNHLTWLYLIHADIGLNSRNLTYTKQYHNLAKGIIEKVTSRYILGYFYCINAEILSYDEHFSESEKIFLKALDYIDVLNHPDLVARIYLRLGRICKTLLRDEQGDFFIDKANEVSNASGNIYFKAWSAMDKSFYLYLSGDLESSKNLSQKSMIYYRQSGSFRGDYYGIDNLARIFLLEGKENESYSTFLKADKIEETFRPEAHFSYTKLYLWFLEAKHSYQRSIKNMENMIMKKEPEFYPSFGYYFYYFTQYKFGITSEDFEQGKMGLTRLSRESKNLIIKNASKRSLETGILQPLR